MGLPLEVRNMIYKHALVRGKIFVPSVISKNLNDVGPDLNLDTDSPGAYIPFMSVNYEEMERYPRYCDYEQYRYGEPIVVGLLKGVSKVVQFEAQAIFLGVGNHFVIPAGSLLYPTILRRDRPNSNRPEKPAFQSISLTFDQRDCAEDSRRWRQDLAEVGFDYRVNYVDQKDMSPEARLKYLHDIQIRELQSIWHEKIAMITQCLELRYLEVDLEECYCPTGCCRLAKFVSRDIRNYVIDSTTLEGLHIIGLASEQELADVQRLMLMDNGGIGSAHATCSITYMVMTTRTSTSDSD